jgi:hypothetical protein
MLVMGAGSDWDPSVMVAENNPARVAEWAGDAIREELHCGQSLEAGQGQGAAAECVGVFLGESVANGLVGGK